MALEATLVEKHFTLDRDLPGPDHHTSLELGELKEMIVSIRNIEKALGMGVKEPNSSEGKNKVIARKSLVAARAIQKGEILNQVNIAVKRPGTGLSPMHWDEALGRKASKDFAPDELIVL